MDDELNAADTCQLTYMNDQKSVFLVSFTNGHVNQQYCDKLKIKVYKDEKFSNEKQHSKKVILVESDRIQYVSTGLEFWSSLKSLVTKYQIGVFNKRKREMKVYDTEMINCVPVLESSSVEDTKEDKSFIQKRDSLTNAFGSKRKKQAVMSRLQNVIDEVHMETKLTDAVESSNINTNTVTSPVTNNISESIPPRKDDASSPNEVYDIYDIITEEEYRALGAEVKILKEASPEEISRWKAEERYCNYVIQYLQFRIQRLDEHKVKLLLYFNYLVVLLKLSYKELRRKDPIPEIPEPIKSNIFHKFFVHSSDNSGKQIRSLPVRMKDKVMACCVILALFIGNFRTDFGSMMKDFKVGIPKLTKIAQALGCHISKKKKDGIDLKVIELKIPLFVPNKRAYKPKFPK